MLAMRLVSINAPSHHPAVLFARLPLAFATVRQARIRGHKRVVRVLPMRILFLTQYFPPETGAA